jgi:hypothetical protein
LDAHTALWREAASLRPVTLRAVALQLRLSLHPTVVCEGPEAEEVLFSSAPLPHDFCDDTGAKSEMDEHSFQMVRNTICALERMLLDAGTFFGPPAA